MNQRSLWLAVVGSLLLVLAACTSRPHASGVTESFTESDEPDARKRARLRVVLASGYLDNGQATVALEEVKRALAADPGYVPAHVLLGLVHMRLNNDSLAESSFRRALQIHPDDPDALHNLGWHVCQQGRPAEAVELFKQVVSLPPYAGTAKTWMTQGICQLRMGQSADAENSFLRSHALDTGHPVTSYNLAALLYRRGEVQRAQAYIQVLNTSDLSNAETLWLGARVERHLLNTHAMEQLIRQLGQRYPQSPEWALYQRGAFDE